jgi:hypothetical protein
MLLRQLINCNSTKKHAIQRQLWRQLNAEDDAKTQTMPNIFKETNMQILIFRDRP